MKHLKKPVKGGPRTAETKALWDARNAALFPGDSVARLRQVTETFDREKAEMKERAQAYYAGGFRHSLDGAPVRVAAHVQKWSLRSRQFIGSYLTPLERRSVTSRLAV